MKSSKSVKSQCANKSHERWVLHRAKKRERKKKEEEEGRRKEKGRRRKEKTEEASKSGWSAEYTIFYSSLFMVLSEITHLQRQDIDGQVGFTWPNDQTLTLPETDVEAYE